MIDHRLIVHICDGLIGWINRLVVSASRLGVTWTLTSAIKLPAEHICTLCSAAEWYRRALHTHIQFSFPARTGDPVHIPQSCGRTFVTATPPTANVGVALFVRGQKLPGHEGIKMKPKGYSSVNSSPEVSQQTILQVFFSS